MDSEETPHVFSGRNGGYGCLSFSSVPGSEFISEQENRAEETAILL